MKYVTLAALVFTALVPIGARAQPRELFDCLPSGARTTCQDVAAGELIDPCPNGNGVYETYRGRVAWHALLYTGPIMVEINAREVPGTRFPLFVEFFAVKDHPTDLGSCDGPGYTLMTAHGSGTCDGWETAGPISLDHWVAVGETYVIRVNFVGDSHVQFQSPYLGCIRVRPAVNEVIPRPWSLVKDLYR